MCLTHCLLWDFCNFHISFSPLLVFGFLIRFLFEQNSREFWLKDEHWDTCKWLSWISPKTPPWAYQQKHLGVVAFCGEMGLPNICCALCAPVSSRDPMSSQIFLPTSLSLSVSLCASPPLSPLPLSLLPLGLSITRVSLIRTLMITLDLSG